MQYRQKGVAVFAPGQTNQPFGPVFDHAILINRLAHVLDDALAQFLELGAFGGTVKERVNIIGIVKHGRCLALCAAGARILRLILVFRGQIKLGIGNCT